MEELEPEPCSLTNRFLIDGHVEALGRYHEHLNRLLLNGEGETIVELGVPLDDEFETRGENLLSVSILDYSSGLTEAELDKADEVNQRIAKKFECTSTTLLTKSCGNGLFSRVVILRRNQPEEDFIEIRVAVVGNVSDLMVECLSEI